MLRGAQKQMIVVRTRNSRVFEEAYFVMRRGKTSPPVCKEDMLWEANRIIECSLAGTPVRTREPSGRQDGRQDGSGYRAVPSVSPAGRTGPDVGFCTCAEEEERTPLLSRRGVVRALWFLLGSLCGGGTVGLLWLML